MQAQAANMLATYRGCRARARRRPGFAPGVVSIMAVLLVSIMSMLAVAFTAVTNNSAQTAANHRGVSQAQAAAESGLTYAAYLLSSYDPPEGGYTIQNTVSEDDAEDALGYFAAYVNQVMGDGAAGYDAAAQVVRVPSAGQMAYDAALNSGFHLEFTLVAPGADEPYRLNVVSVGVEGEISRTVGIDYKIIKDASILEYAVASRGRVIITGDSTVEGDVYTGWERTDYWNRPAPFESTAETNINGKIHTVVSEEQLQEHGISLASYDDDGNLIYEPYDTLQGYHEGVEYNAPRQIPGLSPDDYDTSVYREGLTQLPASGQTQREYFPHAPGDYSQPSYSWSLRLNRQVYENQTISNRVVATGRNALFRNCTFEGVFFINIAGNGTNNVRFENCTFNGIIVTGCPKNFVWTRNALYFTGENVFNNTYMEEATILAPHFNVDLGNISSVEEGVQSTLTGAVVGGIVDVRGNYVIEGTIISMYDTSPHPQGYVTNIGFADDGGEESSALDPEDDIGVIRITPDPSRLLPAGIRSPVIFAREASSYTESRHPAGGPRGAGSPPAQ